MPVVVPADQAEPRLAEQQAVDTGIAQGPAALGVEVEALRGAVDAIEHAAVRNDDEALTRMQRRQPRDRGHTARIEIGEALAAPPPQTPLPPAPTPPPPP